MANEGNARDLQVQHVRAAALNSERTIADLNTPGAADMGSSILQGHRPGPNLSSYESWVMLRLGRINSN